MDQELERVLRGLEEAAEFARTYRFEITPDYVALIERVEAMPRNQPGADKAHVWQRDRTFKAAFTNVTYLGPPR
jgi:hypothetical protein